MKTIERSYVFIGLAFTSQAFFLFLVVLSPRRSTISNEKRKIKMGEAIVLYRSRGSAVDPELLKPTTITSNGVYTAPVTGTYRVSCVGGGGGGGGGCRNSWNSSQVFYGAGGTRGTLNTMNVNLNAGDEVPINLGAGGAGGTNNMTVVSNNSRGTNGGSGGTTTFGSYVTGTGGTYGGYSWSRHVWTNTPVWNNWQSWSNKYFISTTLLPKARIQLHLNASGYCAEGYGTRVITLNGLSYIPGQCHYDYHTVTDGKCTVTVYDQNVRRLYNAKDMTFSNFISKYLKSDPEYLWQMYYNASENSIYTERVGVTNSGNFWWLSKSVFSVSSITQSSFNQKAYAFFSPKYITSNINYNITYFPQSMAILFAPVVNIPDNAGWNNTLVNHNIIQSWNNRVTNSTTRCYTSIQTGSWWYTNANNVATSGTRIYSGDGGNSGKAGNAGFVLIIPPQSA